MASKVYFIAASDSGPDGRAKLERLIKASGVFDFLRPGDNTAVKVHFGEEGNAGFLGPQYARAVCSAISERGAKPFVSDTNTLYKGKRGDCKNHLAIAREHGFYEEALGAPVIIPPDEDVVEVPVSHKRFKTASVAGIFVRADALVALSHFKGHILTGFGGVLKNLGMGCAGRRGKLVQHCDVSPEVKIKKCLGCGACAAVCRTQAIAVENGKAAIDQLKCTGCGMCVEACPVEALQTGFGTGSLLQEKMAHYASAALHGKKGKAGFINIAVKIMKECDCWGMENHLIAQDAGFFASSDPVSLDKACHDVVVRLSGKNVFKEAHPGEDGMIQLEKAAGLGLGSLEYELEEVV